MRKVLPVIGLLLLCMVGSTAQAHHTTNLHFDTGVEVSVTGRVTEWQFVSPHAFLYFEVQNEDGASSQWRCETDAASDLRQRSYTADTFVVGETVTVTGNPALREENYCFFQNVVFADETAIDPNTDVATLNRGVPFDFDAFNIEDIDAVLFGDEPDITGHWWDGDEIIVGAAVNAGAPAPAMGMGMGGGADGALPARLAPFAAIGLTPEGQAIQDPYERIYDDPAMDCEISNIIDALGRNDAINEIRQNGDTLTIRYGYMDYLRTIHLDMDSHPENIELTPGGHSIGKWEGNTLVVDTIGFTPSILNPQVGVPTSDEFHVIERFTYNEESRELTLAYTATDSKNWTDDFQGEDVYRRAPRPYSAYNCEYVNGLNYIRPGTPEYEAEAARLQSQ